MVKIVTISGNRQSGKTTALLNEYIHLTCENTSIRDVFFYDRFGVGQSRRKQVKLMNDFGYHQNLDPLHNIRYRGDINTLTEDLRGYNNVALFIDELNESNIDHLTNVIQRYGNIYVNFYVVFTCKPLLNLNMLFDNINFDFEAEHFHLNIN